MKYYLLHPIKAIRAYFIRRRLKKSFSAIFNETDILMDVFLKALGQNFAKEMSEDLRDINMRLSEGMLKELVDD